MWTPGQFMHIQHSGQRPPGKDDKQANQLRRKGEFPTNAYTAML